MHMIITSKTTILAISISCHPSSIIHHLFSSVDLPWPCPLILRPPGIALLHALSDRSLVHPKYPSRTKEKRISISAAAYRGGRAAKCSCCRAAVRTADQQNKNTHDSRKTAEDTSLSSQILPCPFDPLQGWLRRAPARLAACLGEYAGKCLREGQECVLVVLNAPGCMPYLDKSYHSR